MTACIASDGFPPQTGGIATFNKHLVSLLLQEGHDVVLLLIDYENKSDDKIITESNFTKILLGKSYHQYYKHWQPYFRPGGFDAPNWIAIGLAMRDWLLNNHKFFKIDVIEASDYGGAGIFLCDSQLPPIVITGHGSLLQYSRYNFTKKDDSFKVIRKLEELSFLYGDEIISHSVLNKIDLEHIFKRRIVLAKIPWIHEATQEIHDDDVIENKLVVVGGMQPIKGIYDMITAMEILKIKKPSLILNWIGGDTWLAPGQKLMSPYLERKYPAVWQQNFKWKNLQSFEETQKDIATASLIIVPATFETFNYVALEAALFKKPILITEGAGASSCFTHSFDAYIVPANNPKAIAEAILYLHEKPTLCKELGNNAYQTIKETLNGKTIIAERIEIYKSAIKNKKKSTTGLHPSLLFLNQYRTSVRKYYYCIRRFTKKLIGRG